VAGTPGVTPSACGCGGGKDGTPSQPQKVFALGTLSFDYGSRSRRIYFANAMKNALYPGGAGLPNIDDPGNLYKYLTRRAPVPYTILEGEQFPSRAEVDSFQWILQIDETPIYAIHPLGLNQAHPRRRFSPIETKKLEIPRRRAVFHEW
jgi:PatG Domain